jgi:hypothetical protein
MQREDRLKGLSGAIVQVRGVIRDREQRGNIKSEGAKRQLASGCTLATNLERISRMKGSHILQVLERFLEGVVVARQSYDLRAGVGDSLVDPRVDRYARRLRRDRIGIAGEGWIVDIKNLALGPLRSAVARRAIALEDRCPRRDLRERRGVCWLRL